MSDFNRHFYLWFAPCLLCGVAVLQIVQVRSSQLTPWKGGGFGMFSTVDSADARFLKIYLRTASGETTAGLFAPEPELLKKLQAAPALSDLQRLASLLSQCTWVDGELAPGQQSPQTASSPRRVRPLNPGEPEPDPSLRVPGVEVRVEVWKYRY